MDKIGQIAAAYGDLVVTGVGPHTGFKTRMVVCRVADTVIAGLTVNGGAVTTGITKYQPSGTKLYQGELVNFSETEVITSITLTNATDSLRIIKCIE
jgi:hypothetical protein